MEEYFFFGIVQVRREAIEKKHRVDDVLYSDEVRVFKILFHDQDSLFKFFEFQKPHDKLL